LNPAEEFSAQRLRPASPVVTANKQLIAVEVRSCSSCQREWLPPRFGASVAAAFPFFPPAHRPLRRSPCTASPEFLTENLQLHSQPHRDRPHSLQRGSRRSAGPRLCRSRRQRRSRRRRRPRQTSILALAGLQVRVSPRHSRPHHSHHRSRRFRLLRRARLYHPPNLTRRFERYNAVRRDRPAWFPTSSPFGRVQKNLNMVLTSENMAAT